MMDGDIHRSEAPHGKAANSSMRWISKRSVVPIDKPDQIDSDEGFHELMPIEAITPFACLAWSSIPIREN